MHALHMHHMRVVKKNHLRFSLLSLIYWLRQEWNAKNYPLWMLWLLLVLLLSLALMIHEVHFLDDSVLAEIVARAAYAFTGAH